MTVRTPQQIFQHHAEALGAEDLDGIVADYSDDAFFMTPGGVLRGKTGIRQAFTKLLSDLPKAKWNSEDAALREGHTAARMDGRFCQN